MTLAERPIRAEDAEREGLVVAARLARAGSHVRLEAEGQILDLPESLRAVLELAARELLRGNTVSVIPVGTELTTKQAADVLNVSRPHLVQLLERGDLPYRRVGTHRRISIDEVLAYRARRSSGRREALQALAEDTQLNDIY